ncbi:hypothetical protein V6N13_111450 [Hibiscus sabdariffa]
MEELITNLSKSLGSFCNHLQSSCDALKQSVDRRPIPLDSASSTFVQCLNRRVSTATVDLNLLDSMSFGTVSFEELLGHCYQVFDNNQTHLLHLQDRLKALGYIPQVDIEEEEEEEEDMLDSKERSSAVTGSAMNSFEEDPLFLDESLSLKNFGLSDVCLATLASQANQKVDDSDLSLGENMKYDEDKPSNIKGTYKPITDTIEVIREEEKDPNHAQVQAKRPVLQVSKDGYESLPSYMTNLASWEDLLAAVEKINSSLSKKEKTKGYDYFHQDEIEALDLGPKGRAYLLLLVRMNHLVVETIDGLISYRVLSSPRLVAQLQNNQSSETAFVGTTHRNSCDKPCEAPSMLILSSLIRELGNVLTGSTGSDVRPSPVFSGYSGISRDYGAELAFRKEKFLDVSNWPYLPAYEFYASQSKNTFDNEWPFLTRTATGNSHYGPLLLIDIASKY